MASFLTPRFEDAFRYAFELHANQKRKGTSVPYISHLLGVTALVLEAGGTEDEAIAALLHDAVEDQGGAITLEAIRRRFGEQVAEIVRGCSDTNVTPKPAWRGRKEAYLAHLRSASPSIRRVSLADKIHNARDILIAYHMNGEQVWSRFKGGKEGTLWYYRSLVQVFRENHNNAFVDELDRVVTELEKLAGGEHGILEVKTTL